MSKENVLKVENVTMQFGGVIAVDNLNLEVNQGEIVSLIGPNGAGKTTAFNVITGVYAPTNGAVYYKGSKIIENLPKLYSDIVPYARVREGLPLTTPISKLNDLESLLLVYRYFPKSDLAAVDKKIQSKFEQLIKRSKASPELTSALMELTDLKWPYLAKYLSDERLLSKRAQGCSLDQGLAYAYVKTGRPEALGLKRIELEGKDAD